MAALDTTIPPQIVTPVMPTDAPPAPPPSAPQDVPVESGNMVAPPKQGISPLILILGGILILAVIGFVVYTLFFQNRETVGPSKKEETVTWWGLWEDEAVVASTITSYQSQNPNIKINYIKQSKEDYRERLTNALAKGTGPDIFTIHNTWVPMFKNDLDQIPNSVVSAVDYPKIYYPVAVSDLSLGSGFVGIPTGFDSLALFINEEIFNTQGKATPKTWDELRQTATELTIKDENGVIQQAGVALGRTENVDHWPEILALMMLQNGVKMTQPDLCSSLGGSEAGSSTESCPGADALSFFSLFATVDQVWDETLPPSTIAFSGGKLAMYFGPSWRVFEIKQQNPNLKFKVVPVPQLPKDTPNQPDVAYASYWAIGVSKRSQVKSTAWDFVKSLSSSESLQKMYTAAASQRLFGEIYPRVDMASLLTADPMASVFVAQAPAAKSWYLASRTFDGPTGINTQIAKYFEDAVNTVNKGTTAKDALQTVTQGVNQVLTTYGLVNPATQP